MNRFERILNWPRAKKRRLWNRYNQWLLFRLKKYGPGPTISHDREVANRKMQLEINRRNDLFAGQHPNF